MARTAKKDNRSQTQILLGIHLRELGFERIEYEFQFCPTRKWKCDVYLPAARLLIECDGGLHSGGHKRGFALEDDYDKQNTAQMMGYRFLRFSNAQIRDGRAKQWIQEQM